MLYHSFDTSELALLVLLPPSAMGSANADPFNKGRGEDYNENIRHVITFQKNMKTFKKHLN